MTKRHKLASAVRSALLASSAAAMALSVQVQAADATSDEDEADDNKIVVTGSRIKRNQIEGSAPVTVLTRDDIEKKGFTTAFEALSSLTQFNGSNQDDQFSGGFTQAANSLNLRGLGPGRLLTLINGRRTADYPLPFNGQSNIVNLANIPSVMIEKIEVLSGGASAIYGSDAVAGVINIILRKNIDATQVTLRIGDTYEANGETQRLEIAGGFQESGFELAWGIEYFNREPIRASELEFQDSTLDDPTLGDPANVVNSRTFLTLDPFDSNGDGFTYTDPGAAACDPLTGLYNGTVEYSFRPGAGNYCGTNTSISNFTVRNAKENVSAFANWSFELNSDHELFGLTVFNDSETTFNTGTPFWQYTGDSGIGSGYFINSAGTDFFGIGGETELWQRIFSPEEMGGPDANDNVFSEQLIDFGIGMRGVLTDTIDYTVYYTAARYDLERTRRLVVAADADQFFLGSQTGTTDFGFGDWAVFSADRNRLYTPLTPSEFQSITDKDVTSADSANNQLSFELTGELFEMEAGPVGFAAVLEYGSQEYNIDLDPRLIAGEFAFFTGTAGGGERDRYALGFEASIPLHETFTANTAVRWDKYDDITEVDDAISYNLGLEWRPLDGLLVRASASTSFRAPDMHYVFADPSGFFTNVTDQYLCRRDEPGVSFAACTNSSVSIQGARQGSPFLEEEEGESMTFGFVWDYAEGGSLSVDWYNIELTGAVRDRSIGLLLETEADCRLGQTTGGAPVDINSAECQNVISLITRNPVVPGVPLVSEALQDVVTGPINASLLSTHGIDAKFNYRWDVEDIGSFGFELSWNHVYRYLQQQFPGDDIDDIRSNLQNFTFRSTVNWSLNWRKDDWSSTWFTRRTGSIPNWAETDRSFEHFVHNWSLGYNYDNNLSVGLFVQNVFNERPPQDPTYDQYPYYSSFQFNPYGREIFLQASYKFGN